MWVVAALVPLATVAWAGTRAAQILDGGERRESLSWTPSLGLTVGLRLAFAGAMAGLVLTENLFALYVFWELTTVASFLLIAGYGCGEATEEQRAAREALLVTVAGVLACCSASSCSGRRPGRYRVSASSPIPLEAGPCPSR